MNKRYREYGRLETSTQQILEESISGLEVAAKNMLLAAATQIQADSPAYHSVDGFMLAKMSINIYAMAEKAARIRDGGI